MRAIMVMFDSLNRHFLPNYGCGWTKAPNFRRLGEQTVTFDNSFVGSLPCMPARRELHTGRMNFLHRSWGPLEPFDDSMPEILKNNGIYTHLTSDHAHYWQEGGSIYHNKYSSWECSRGQEGDRWKALVGDVDLPAVPFSEEGYQMKDAPFYRQEYVNRKFYKCEADQPQAVTFQNGLDFIERNVGEDNWFLQIETFDPHEPFYAMQHYKDLYPDNYDGPAADWPPYHPVRENEDFVKHVRREYAALLSMCDTYLGKVLDAMDQNDMWKDTMLIVNTDHGYLLGEHGWWAKSVMPVYNEIANTPLFVWDPRSGVRGERRDALVQTIDLAPTLLDFFGVEIPCDMEGAPLRGIVEHNEKIREYAIYGYHGGHINCTDGKHVYMRASVTPDNQPLYEYTLMPTHMHSMFALSELQNIEVVPPFGFSKGCMLMKTKAASGQGNPCKFGTLLFDILQDPGQLNPIEDSEVERKMMGYIADFMERNEAPEEQYRRLGISKA